MTIETAFDFNALKTMSEEELREIDVPFFKREKDVIRFIRNIINRDHEYGTCVYAMSLSAIAAFNYVCSRLGTTGFQASCADMDFLARTRGMKDGFSILDYNRLLYPQYLDKFNKTAVDYIYSNLESLQDKALDLLEKSEGMTHPDVKAHWEWILSLKPKEVNE